MTDKISQEMAKAQDTVELPLDLISADTESFIQTHEETGEADEPLKM